MEWERAKTILIAIFLLLNGGLFAMGLYLEDTYKISREDVAAIEEILLRNDISVECNLPLVNKPMRFLNLEAVEWDYSYIKNVFFPEAQNVTRTYEDGSVIYKSSETGVSVAVTNVYTGGVSQIIYTLPASNMDAYGYVELLGERLNGFELMRAFSDDTGKTYIFNDSFKDVPIFPSGAEIVFLTDETVGVSVKKMEFSSYSDGGPHEIFRIDEALLAFMHYKNDNMTGKVVIEDVRLGYGTDGGLWERSQKAKPFYRIYIAGQREPVYIDAVMNTVEIRD